MMIKAVIFDMDGTLIDSERLGAAAWLQAADELGLEFSQDVSRGFIGRTLPDVLATLADLYGSEEDGERLWRRHREIREEMAKTDLELKAGASSASMRWLPRAITLDWRPPRGMRRRRATCAVLACSTSLRP